MQQMIIVTAVSSRVVWILALGAAAAAASAFALFRISYVLFLPFCNRGESE